MGKGRLEAFSDGVIAVIITIMVLEMKAPHGTDLHSLVPVLPVFANYTLSFVFIAIYWNNHHHMLAAVQRIDGRVMWTNLHLLFWLSLVPFVTSWMGENHFAAVPTALYGIVLLMSALATRRYKPRSWRATVTIRSSPRPSETTSKARSPWRAIWRPFRLRSSFSGSPMRFSSS